MFEHLAHDSHHFLTSIVIIIVLVLVVLALLYWGLRKKDGVSQQRYLNASNLSKRKTIDKANNSQGANDDELKPHDTIFVIPDISHYTKFIAGNHFSASQSQEIIFSLINAMIEASADAFELSKVEGDAVLFFADAREHSSEKIGQEVIAIFDAFFEEKQKIMESGWCSCAFCKHINDLDLKIFVHRGTATRFSFRGSIDHFGADVIILHRLMKNSLTSNRYVMITDAAHDSVSLNGNFSQEFIEEDLGHLGTVRATVHKIDKPLRNFDHLEPALVR